MKIAGILLIIAGAISLIYGGISYTSKEKAIDMGPLQVYRTEHHYFPVPAIFGFVVLVGGGVMIYAGTKQGR